MPFSVPVLQGLIPNNFSRKNANGFTMVETLVAFGVLAIFFVAVVIILRSILANVASSRIRTTALALAQQKMETIRNLPYASVGTAGGIPTGSLPQTEIVTINTQPFTVTTSIQYIDDPFDGSAPTDTINSDYKRVRVEVSWQGAFPSKYPVTLVTNLVPKGIESTSGGGTIFVKVFDANGQPISNATVTIDNTAVNPTIHISTLTDSSGFVILPGAPACVACYKIKATKTGYSTDKTYSSQEVANPILSDITVIAGQISQLSLAIDHTSTLIVNSLGSGPSYPILGNVLFTLRGSKIIGTDTQDVPVYKYTFSTNTGGGTVSIPDLEWDTYALDLSSSYHDLAGSIPTTPFAVSPGLTSTITIIGVPKTNTSLLVVVKDASGQLQSSASAQLTNIPLNVNLTQTTAATGAADYGQTFFGGLTPATYGLKVNLPGFIEATTSVQLSGFRQEFVTLSQ